MIIDIFYSVIGTLEATFSIVLRGLEALLPASVDTALNTIAENLNKLISQIWIIDGIIRVQTLIDILVFITIVWLFKYIYNIGISLFNMTPFLTWKNPKVSMKKDDE